MIELNGSQPMEIKVLGELGPGGNQGRYEAFPWALREGRHILGIWDEPEVEFPKVYPAGCGREVLSCV